MFLVPVGLNSRVVGIIWPGIGIMLHNGFMDTVGDMAEIMTRREILRKKYLFFTKITCENLLFLEKTVSAKSRDKLTYSSAEITIELELVIVVKNSIYQTSDRHSLMTSINPNKIL